MIYQIRLAPPNSVVLVMDQTAGQVPISMHEGVVTATASCVAVGTLAEADGDTFVSLSDESPPRLPQLAPVFDGVLNTPARRLSVCSVCDEPLLEIDVLKTRTRVRIWVNHPSEPDEVWIVAGDSPD